MRLAVLILLILPIDALKADTYRKVGYFVRASTDFNRSAAKLTHLHYAFGDVSSKGECEITEDDAVHDYQKIYSAAHSVDGVADNADQPLAGAFNQIKKLKARYGLRTSISIGGGSGSRFFSDVALTPAARKKFVESCIRLYLRGDLPQLPGAHQGGPDSGVGVFDGIDLDWEYPEDKHNFTLLLQEFRRQLDIHGRQTGKYYLLTAALAGSAYRIDRAYEVPAIFDYLDWAVVMSYDMHGAWENPLKTNHQAALSVNPADPSTPVRSSELYIHNFISRGVKPNQLILGVPFYSRGWTGVTNVNNGLFQDARSGTTPVADTYRDIRNLQTQGYTRYWDDIAQTAWLFNGSTFWTFDDPQSMHAKAAFVKRQSLGGIGIWAMHGDDEDASLMTAIDDELKP